MVQRSISHLSLEQIAASGQCFTWARLGPCRWAVVHGQNRVEVSQEGEQFSFSCTERQFEEVWKPYFDLDTDYGTLVQSVDPADEYLTGVVEYGRGIRVLRQDFWEVTVSFLISQNNNITRITRSMAELRRKYGRSCGEFLAFPRPEGLAGAGEEDFRELGLGYRAKYLVRLARELSGGGLEQLEGRLKDCGDEEAEKVLMGLYGIGKKVADCICLFGLHRADFFPVDTHIRQIFSQHYPGGFPSERYRGNLGRIQQYLFYYDLKKTTGAVT